MAVSSWWTRLIAFQLVLLFPACGGRALESGKDLAVRDQPVPQKLPDKGLPPHDQRSGPDLPTQPFAPCVAGQCGSGLLCIANICYLRCQQPDPKCHDKTGCGPGTTCLSEPGAEALCRPGKPVGVTCDSDTPCEDGALCVDTGQETKCLRLCKYGCGDLCAITTTRCEVCNE